MVQPEGFQCGGVMRPAKAPVVMSHRMNVPTKSQIETKLYDLRCLLEEAETVSEVEDELDDEIGQLRCDIANRVNEEQKAG